MILTSKGSPLILSLIKPLNHARCVPNIRFSPLSYFKCAALLPFLVAFFAYPRASWLGSPRPRSPLWEPSAWEGLCEVGPAVTPVQWQASRPAVLLMAYPHWHGIFAAASAQGPVMGTLTDFNERVSDRLVALIADTPSLQVLVVHGIPHGTIPFSRALKRAIPAMRILFVYHGSSAQPFHADESGLVAQLVDAAREGVVEALGTVKVGLASVLSSMGAPRVFTVPNFPYINPTLPVGKYSDIDGRPHIGVFVSSSGFHKNVATQVLAACSIPNAVVHVTFPPALAYLRNCTLVEPGWLSHGRLLLEVARMDAVMYVSMTECYPMLVIEAISSGIPVVTSLTHHILDSDAVLSSALIVTEPDNPENIRAILAGALSRTKELRPRLLLLTARLRRQAELEWGAVLNLPPAESMRLQLLEHVECGGRGVALPCGGGDGPPVRALPAPLNTTLSSPMRIAFMTYELSPVNYGGAGVVVSHLAEALLAAGHGVTILAFMDEALLRQWVAHMRAKGFQSGEDELLVVRHIPSLVAEDALPCAPANIFLRRASLFALAAQRAFAAQPFDALEVFDYAGAAFELLRRRNDWQRAEKRGDPSGISPPYLPLNVPVLIRLHGSLQLIHQYEGIILTSGSPETPRPCLASDKERDGWALMHLMERYAIAVAPLLFAQSHAMARVYTQAYGIMDRGRILIAPPPLERILAPIRVGSQPVRAPAQSGDMATMTSLRGEAPKEQLRLLVYGRIAHVKGAETVASAAAAIRRGLPAHCGLQLFFVGDAQECSVHGRPTSDCVKELLPQDVDAVFAPGISREELPALAAKFHGGIIASNFETFGLAAHELAATGLPLVISDIPAFAEYFTKLNSYAFRAGDADSLAAAVLALAEDVLRNNARVATLKYSDPLAPYLRATALARSGASILPPLQDTRVLEVAIDAAEASCWPSLTCRRSGVQA